MKLATRLGCALAFVLFASPAFARAKPEVTCSDGTTSKGGRGACSKHGGIAPTGAAAAPAQSAPAPAPATPAAPAAPARSSRGSSKAGTEGPDANSAGATAKCKDGSFSHSKGHSGACSRHGGVAQWLNGK